jgi:hypothetical protein
MPAPIKMNNKDIYHESVERVDLAPDTAKQQALMK